MLSFVGNLLNYLLAIVFHFGLEEIFEKIFNLWILILYGNIYIYEFNFKNFRMFKFMIRAYLFHCRIGELRENFVAIPRICTVYFAPYYMACSCILRR